MSLRSSKGLGPLRGNSSALSPLSILGIVVAASLTVGLVNTRLQAQGKSNPLLGGTRLAIFPFQTGASHVRAGLLDGWRSLFAGQQISQENVRLTAEIARLQVENESLRTRAAEADRLRDALKFAKEQKNSPLPAPVIGWLPSPHYDTIVIGRGTRDGIAMKTIARTPAGLIGQVIGTSPLSSEVMLLTDLNSRVSAMIWRDGKPTTAIGIVQGVGRGLPLQMVYLKREDDVRPGDKVVSSGYGGVVPPDVPIGVVEQVDEDKPRFLKSAQIKPAAPLPGDLREVFLLR